MLKITSIILIVGAVSLGAIALYRNKQSSQFDTLETKNTPIVNHAESLLLQQEENIRRYISPINIEYLREQNIDSQAPVIEQVLAPGSNYKRYIASYVSEGNKIFGLLTIPNEVAPEGGFPAIVFNHGYIPPSDYVTTEKYIAYVDTLARNGFVVFKIDMRGHGNSDGVPTGSYFSSAYTIDAISALKSLQKLESEVPEELASTAPIVNSDRIGMWGHSMAGNLLLRAMLVEEDVKAGVIWAGAVYSYEDFAKYRISDSSYRGRPRTSREETPNREVSEEIAQLRENSENLNFSDPFWKSISLTQNINYLNAPLQIHHAVDDATVDIGYSRDLAKVLEENNKDYELYEYNSGGHNISGISFNTAIQRTVDFFKANL